MHRRDGEHGRHGFTPPSLAAVSQGRPEASTWRRPGREPDSTTDPVVLTRAASGEEPTRYQSENCPNGHVAGSSSAAYRPSRQAMMTREKLCGLRAAHCFAPKANKTLCERVERGKADEGAEGGEALCWGVLERAWPRDSERGWSRNRSTVVKGRHLGPRREPDRCEADRLRAADSPTPCTAESNSDHPERASSPPQRSTDATTGHCGFRPHARWNVWSPSVRWSPGGRFMPNGTIRRGGDK